MSKSAWLFVAFADPLRMNFKSRRAYSKTSNNGPSEKRTTSVRRKAHLPPIDFTLELIHYKPPRSGHLSTDTDQPPMYISQYKIT